MVDALETKQKQIMQKTRYIPTGFTEYKPEIGDYPKDLFAVYVDLAKLTAIFYAKKQSKHTFYNRFRTMDDMKKKINDTIGSLMSWEDTKVERAEKRKEPTTLKVGDILDSSWGYDQTNVNFYQITRMIGTKMVELREVASKIDHSEISANYVVALKDQFLVPRNEYDKRGLPFTRRAKVDGVSVSSYEWASCWNGNPKYETAAGWGH